MKNERGPFHDLLLGNISLSMLVVIILCALGLLIP